MSELPAVAVPYIPLPQHHPWLPPSPTRSGFLLSVIRKIIIFATTLRLDLLSPETADQVKNRFGTWNGEWILSRIQRALRIAGALEQRVIDSARSLDRPRRKPAEPLEPEEPFPLQPDEPTIAPTARRLPSAQQLARRFRREPIGAVVAELCRELQIIAEDKLWLQILAVTTDYRGAPYRMMRDMRKRIERTGFFVPDDPPIRPFIQKLLRVPVAFPQPP